MHVIVKHGSMKPPEHYAKLYYLKPLVSKGVRYGPDGTVGTHMGKIKQAGILMISVFRS